MAVQKILFCSLGVSLPIFIDRYYNKRKTIPCLMINEEHYDIEKFQLPTRQKLKARLQNQHESYDLLIVGGGSTGAGISVEASLKGLKVALVERDDFSSGTSSKSTKLIHGGVRYLQSAIEEFDFSQLSLVIEALRERKTLCSNAPHIVEPIPIIIPVYKWWLLPYYWFGMKLYDVLSGSRLLHSSHYISKDSIINQFPMINKENLCGGIVFFDGQQDDSRMNVELILTGIKLGSVSMNYVNVKELIFKDPTSNNKIVIGAILQDKLTGEEWPCYAKCVVNATGPYVDQLRGETLNDNQKSTICMTSSGVHIVISKELGPKNHGVLIPSTKDGRLMFILPWKGQTIIGTTDNYCELDQHPKPTLKEVNFIINEFNGLIDDRMKIELNDIKSAWSGLRPLVRTKNLSTSSKESDNKSLDQTKSISRHHAIVNDAKNGGFITISGGKWTIYRSMAEDVVKEAVFNCLNSDQSSVINKFTQNSDFSSSKYPLIGATDWSKTSGLILAKKYSIPYDIAEHLSNTYGSRSEFIITKYKQHLNRIHPNYLYLEAEIMYSCEQEYACHLVDIISRRSRVAFIDCQLTSEIMDKVASIMAKCLNWNNKTIKNEINEALAFLNEQMGHQFIKN